MYHTVQYSSVEYLQVSGEVVTHSLVPGGRDSLAAGLYLRTVTSVVRRINWPGSQEVAGPGSVSVLDMVSLQGGDRVGDLQTLGTNLLCETVQVGCSCNTACSNTLPLPSTSTTPRS